MTEEEIKVIAQQLRKPEGHLAREVATFMSKGNSNLYRNVLKHLQPEENHSILEVGMANGNFAGEIISKGRNLSYCGVDYSQDMVDAAKDLNMSEIHKENMTFIKGNAESLPLESDSYDHVISINTIYFFKDPVKTLKGFKRVMKSGGKLLLGLRPEHEMRTYPMAKYNFKMYSKEQIDDLLKAADLKVDRIFEEKEPDQELNGDKIAVTSMIAIGYK